MTGTQSPAPEIGEPLAGHGAAIEPLLKILEGLVAVEIALRWKHQRHCDKHYTWGSPWHVSYPRPAVLNPKIGPQGILSP